MGSRSSFGVEFRAPGWVMSIFVLAARTTYSHLFGRGQRGGDGERTSARRAAAGCAGETARKTPRRRRMCERRCNHGRAAGRHTAKDLDPEIRSRHHAGIPPALSHHAPRRVLQEEMQAEHHTRSSGPHMSFAVWRAVPHPPPLPDVAQLASNPDPLSTPYAIRFVRNSTPSPAHPALYIPRHVVRGLPPPHARAPSLAPLLHSGPYHGPQGACLPLLREGEGDWPLLRYANTLWRGNVWIYVALQT